MKLLVIALLTVILVSSVISQAFASANSDAKSTITKAIDKAVAGQWKGICDTAITTGPNQTLRLVYDKNVNRCNGVIPTPSPNPPPNPPPTPVVNCAIGNFNHSSTFRIATFADTDANSGTAKLFQLMKDCGAQYHIINGDLWYSKSSSDWFNMAGQYGLSPTNTDISVGNHDSDGSAIKNWLGETSTWNVKTTANGTVSVFAINANTKFDCSSAQYNEIKSDIAASKSLYKIITVHQPFVTVKSTHGENGQIGCYQPLFKTNNIAIVLQGHNHLYMQGLVDGLRYIIAGMGTHDTGSGLYPCDSNNDGHGNPMKCITKENGVLFLDLNLKTKKITGNFININNKILDTFTN